MDNYDERIFGRRVGFLVDGVDGTPLVPATLVAVDARGFNLEVQYEGDSAWFGDGWMGEWRMPSTLGFVDDLGQCTLVDCHMVSTNGGGSRPIGKATARVGALLNGVMALDGDAGQAREMRSTVTGLHEWMGWSVSDREVTTDAQGLIETMSVHFKAPEPIRLSSAAGELTLAGHWRQGQGQAEVVEETVISTRFPQLAPWEQHASRHGIVRDLVSLCLWQGCEYLSHEVRRPDWPVRSMAGTAMGPAWWRLVTDRYRRSSMPPKQVKASAIAHGISFHDIGGEVGLERWIDISKQYARSIGPLVSVLFERGSLEGSLMQIGIAMEAFAYQVCIDSGMDKRTAGAMSIGRRTERVTELLLEDGDWDFDPGFDWPQMFADAYNAVKHANRALPGSDTVFAAYFTGAQVLRRALLQKMGADHDRLDVVWNAYNWRRGIWPAA